jgi:hypothetical protein
MSHSPGSTSEPHPNRELGQLLVDCLPSDISAASIDAWRSNPLGLQRGLLALLAGRLTENCFPVVVNYDDSRWITTPRHEGAQSPKRVQTPYGEFFIQAHGTALVILELLAFGRPAHTDEILAALQRPGLRLPDWAECATFLETYPEQAEELWRIAGLCGSVTVLDDGEYIGYFRCGGKWDTVMTGPALHRTDKAWDSRVSFLAAHVPVVLPKW